MGEIATAKGFHQPEVSNSQLDVLMLNYTLGQQNYNRKKVYNVRRKRQAGDQHQLRLDESISVDEPGPRDRS